MLDAVFQIRGQNARAIIRHIKGHQNHIHFRFHNPVAEELGRRLARFIVLPRPAPVTAAHHTEVAGVTFAQHRAKNGDTLVVLAKRYGTTVEEIQKANGLKSHALRAGAVYRIPQRVAQRPTTTARAPRSGGHASARKAPPPHKHGSSAKGRSGKHR